MVENKGRPSTIDSSWTVYDCDSSKSGELRLLFKVYGIAMADLGSKSIFIDTVNSPHLSDDHLLAIEAHEIAHGRLQHATRDIDLKLQEMEADWYACRILSEMNLMTPRELLAERYRKLYGEGIDLLDEYMEDILRTLSE